MTMQAELSIHFEKGIDWRFFVLYYGVFQSTTKLTTPISFYRVSLTANSFKLQTIKSPGSLEVLVPASDIDMFGEEALSEIDG